MDVGMFIKVPRVLKTIMWMRSKRPLALTFGSCVLPWAQGPWITLLQCRVLVG